jgi:hypothetical protein
MVEYFYASGNLTSNLFFHYIQCKSHSTIPLLNLMRQR